MASLLNPFLIRTGLLYDIATPTPIPESSIKFATVLQNVLIPILLFMVLAFFLKHRYNKKRERLTTIHNEDMESVSTADVFY